MKPCRPTIKFCQPIEHYIPTVTENKLIIWNNSFSDPTSIYLFEFSNNDNIIMCEICSKLTIKVSDIVLMSSMLTLNLFDTLL